MQHLSDASRMRSRLTASPGDEQVIPHLGRLTRERTNARCPHGNATLPLDPIVPPIHSLHPLAQKAERINARSIEGLALMVVSRVGTHRPA
jgi:hypothetical protein